METAEAAQVIVEHAEMARRLAAKRSAAEFANDWEAFYAATVCVEIIGAASQRMAQASGSEGMSANWKEAADFGRWCLDRYDEVEPKHIRAFLIEVVPDLERAAAESLRCG